MIDNSRYSYFMTCFVGNDNTTGLYGATVRPGDRRLGRPIDLKEIPMRMRRPSAAMVVALATLVLSAGGGVTAGVLITSADIADETIRSADIRTGTIDGADVHNGAITGVDIAHDSLTGADVNEELLGKVPDAARLDGLPATRFVRKAEVFTRHFFLCGHRLRERLYGRRLRRRELDEATAGRFLADALPLQCERAPGRG